MPQAAHSKLAKCIALLRRFGIWLPVRHLVVGVGLVAMASYTVPEWRRTAGPWLLGSLWCCLAFLGTESAVHLFRVTSVAIQNRQLASRSGVIDLLVLLPVPVALALGVEPQSAWLLASLWSLKLAQNSFGVAQLGRVIVLQAKPLASVLALFLIVSSLSSAAIHIIERGDQPFAFGTMPAALWWTVVTLTTTGYGDAVPRTALGHLLGSIVMICGIAIFGLLTGILATGFAAESRRRNFIETWDLVSQVPFFQTLDPTAITEVTHMLRRVEVPERTAVMRRGRIGDCMYFIASGEVEVETDVRPVRLGVGAFFGELALLGNSFRTANVATTMPSTLLALDLADFRTIMAHHPELARVVEVEAKRRLIENA